ncbi:hypothetical protein BH11CYA1_BH11CYA1_26340 [soil metagenome]
MDLTANTKKWRQTLGNLGEQIASDYLSELGFELWARNFRVHRLGEIDIIASQNDKALVFAEVKTRMADQARQEDHSGQLAVDVRKQRKIINTAFHFVDLHRGKIGSKRKILQFDVVLIDYHLSRGQVLALLVADDLAMLRSHAKVLHIPEAFGRFQ